LAWLSSLQASAQVLLKSNALDLISFQLRPIYYAHPKSSGNSHCMRREVMNKWFLVRQKVMTEV
jgi:hypothetical protein